MEDPRRNSGNHRYGLMDIVFLTLTGVVCSAREWTEIGVMPSEAIVDQTEADHGRIEQRRVEVLQDFRFLDEAIHWEDLASIVRVQTKRSAKA